MHSKHGVLWTVLWALWCHLCFGKKSPGLSAGRVQSVAVKLLVEREREINVLYPGRVLGCAHDTKTTDKTDSVQVAQKDGVAFRPVNEAQTLAAVSVLDKAQYREM